MVNHPSELESTPLGETKEFLSYALPLIMTLQDFPPPDEDQFYKLHALWPISSPRQVEGFNLGMLQEELKESLEDMMRVLGKKGRDKILDQAYELNQENSIVASPSFDFSTDKLDKDEAIKAGYELLSHLAKAEAIADFIRDRNKKTRELKAPQAEAYSRWLAFFMLKFGFIKNYPAQTPRSMRNQE